MTTRAALISLAGIFLITAVSFAGTLEYAATVDKNKAGVGEPILLTLTFTGVQNAPAPQLNLDGFKASYVGPFTQLSVINGKASASVSHRYRLIPQKRGVFAIGPFSANVEGQSLTAAAITVDVSDRQSTTSTQPAPGALSQLNDRAYVVLEVDKKTAFINEKLALTVKLFVNRLPIKEVRFPLVDAQGFSLGGFSQPRQYQVAINGIPFDVLEFGTSLFATRAGEFSLGPAQIVCTLLVSRNQENSLPPEFQGLFSAGIFNNFFGAQAQPLEIKSLPIAITILPLPEENKPALFSGAVGNFSLEASARPQKVNCGDPITVKMTVRGQGNFATVTNPLFVNENDFKMYEPEVKAESESKSFEQVITPLVSTLTQIPQIGFSFFDPAAGQYRTLTAGPWPLEVAEATAPSPSASSPAENQNSAVREEKLGSDIFYIKESASWKKKEFRFLFQQPVFWIMLAFPLPVLWGFLLWAQEKKKIDCDARYARRLLAPRKAKNGLRLARQLLGAGKNQEFFTVLSKIIREYFGDRFHIPGVSVTLDTVVGHIDTARVPQEIIDKTARIFTDCDAARYAPTTFQKERLSQALSECETVIDFFEKGQRAEEGP